MLGQLILAENSDIKLLISWLYESTFLGEIIMMGQLVLAGEPSNALRIC